MGSRTRALSLCQNRRPWMTPYGRYTLLQKRCVFRSPPQTNLNEDRMTLSSLLHYLQEGQTTGHDPSSCSVAELCIITWPVINGQCTTVQLILLVDPLSVLSPCHLLVTPFYVSSIRCLRSQVCTVLCFNCMLAFTGLRLPVDNFYSASA